MITVTVKEGVAVLIFELLTLAITLAYYWFASGERHEEKTVQREPVGFDAGAILFERAAATGSERLATLAEEYRRGQERWSVNGGA